MTRLHPKPDPDRMLSRLPDGPLCAHLAQNAFEAALDLLAQLGALRPFGVVMDGTGAVHLRVPPAASRPPRGLLEAVDELLDAEPDALIRARVDAVDLRSGEDAHHAVRVVLRRRGRDTLTAYQLFAMVDGEPEARAWWVEGVPEEEPTL
jgi:hypothetical protein